MQLKNTESFKGHRISCRFFSSLRTINFVFLTFNKVEINECLKKCIHLSKSSHPALLKLQLPMSSSKKIIKRQNAYKIIKLR